MHMSKDKGTYWNKKKVLRCEGQKIRLLLFILCWANPKAPYFLLISEADVASPDFLLLLKRAPSYEPIIAHRFWP